MPRSLCFDPKEVLKHHTNNRLEATSQKDSHFWGVEVVLELATKLVGQFQTKNKGKRGPSETTQRLTVLREPSQAQQLEGRELS
jgi:hypothetical protein